MGCGASSPSEPATATAPLDENPKTTVEQIPSAAPDYSKTPTIPNASGPQAKEYGLELIKLLPNAQVEDDAIKFLEKGCDLTITDDNGVTALHVGSARGFDILVKMLLKAGADPSLQDKDGSTALHCAAGYADSRECLEAILADPRGKKAIKAVDEDGDTPLHWGASQGKLWAVRALIDEDAEVNALNKAKQTPLHSACKFGHAAISAELIRAGADLELQDTHDDTPLHLAVKSENLETVQVLQGKGANTRKRNKSGVTPADLAGSPEIRMVLPADRL